MDATVNDFLNEINKLSSKNNSKEDKEVWQECFDELTGYSYFWNTETDEVTWVPPKSYKPAKKTNVAKSTLKEKKKHELFVPPATQYSTTSVKPEAKVKVYSIQDVIKKPDVKQTVPSVSPILSSAVKKGPPVKHDDSDDEKIELITEYGENSDSGDDETPSLNARNDTKNMLGKPVSPARQYNSPVRPHVSSPIRDLPVRKTSVTKKPSSSRHGESQSENDEDDDDDDIDLLAKIQQRAQELKKLGGEVPPAVKHIIQNSDVKEKVEASKVASKFSLVAGYNSDSSDSETELQDSPPQKSVFPVAPPPEPIPETSHSTLFPITKPIDVKDFIGADPTPNETVKETNTSAPSSDFDSKAFQRKRRIGISLVNNAKRPKETVDSNNSEFAGFGFKSDNTSEHKSDKADALSSTYPGFQKGGVMFVKSDILNPVQERATDKLVGEENSIDRKETEDDYTVLREKLLFLGEGREPVLPVQVMLIQAETLFLAMKEGGLKLSYLHKWLKEMCSELIKLEKEAAPEGWLLQWDRSHKRYFYQNQTTGVSQWRYPEPDVTRCDDAMDISTTPPPQELPSDVGPSLDLSPVSPVAYGPHLPPAEPPLPPSPPKIRSPTPPPPPVISGMNIAEPVIKDVPLPPEQYEPVILQPPLPPLENGQPLPPGVDLLPESYSKPKEPEAKPPDRLITALDSFYSEIAEVSENTNSCSPTSSSQLPEALPIESIHQEAALQQHSEGVKKKKKKVKLAQGLTMKKKGVSQLVEKWKNVQKNYGD